MSKMLRIILVIIVSVTLWLPYYREAKAAAWHSPHGDLWTIKLVCQDGVEILRVLSPNHSEFDNPAYIDLNPLSFSAFEASLLSSDEPQLVYGPWPERVSKKLLDSATIAMHYHLTPFTWVDNNGTFGTPGQQYTTNVYEIGSVEWTPLPVGTSVMVHLTGAMEDYFIGSVTDCTL